MEKRVITVEWLAEALLFWSWGHCLDSHRIFFGGRRRWGENLPILIMLAQIPVFSAIGQ